MIYHAKDAPSEFEGFFQRKTEVAEWDPPKLNNGTGIVCKNQVFLRGYSGARPRLLGPFFNEKTRITGQIASLVSDFLGTKCRNASLSFVSVRDRASLGLIRQI